MAIIDMFKRAQRTFENVEGMSLPEDANPIGIRSIEVGQRVDLVWLEAMYRRDPDTFAAINHRVRTFMSSEYCIVAEDKKIAQWYTNFLKEVRFDIILRKIILYCNVYGNAWIEIIRNKKGKIVGFDHLDPKTMDFSRDAEGRIIYDSYNNPQYYVQILPENVTISGPKASRVINHISIRNEGTSQGIRLEQDEIAHFTLHSIGDQLDGIGLIEPMWNALVAKQQIEKDWSLAMKKAASPLVVAKAGNELHRPTKQMIKKLSDTTKEIQSTSVITLPYYHDIELKSAPVQSLEPNLSYYVDKIAASTGVPKPYIIGSGDNTPRSTFKGLNLGYERDIKETQDTVANNVEVQIFKLLSEDQKFNEVPYLEFEYPSIEYMDAKAKRIVNYVNSGVLYPDKMIRDIIRRYENLPPEPEGLDELIESKNQPSISEDEEDEEDKEENKEKEEIKQNGKL